MSHDKELTSPLKTLYVNLLMATIFTILVSFAIWLLWVTYFREHYDAGVIEINYSDGMADIRQTSAAGTRGLRFHNTKELKTEEESLSACVVCHSEYPHAKSKSVRAFLNAHSYVMTCEVCHLKLDGDTELAYRWLEVDTNNVLKSKLPDHRFKIVPVQNVAGEFRRFDQSENIAAIREYVKQQADMTDAFREAMVKETHVNVSDEAISCSDCHNLVGQPFISYEDLSYSTDRIDELLRIEVAGMVHKYEDFYMPSLIKESTE
ncbi:MAG: hypothetical protein P8166_00385 [Candidatus Thiodiazotropha sp.]|jgi:hypothetical protein